MKATRRTVLAAAAATGATTMASAAIGAPLPAKRAYRRIATEEGFLCPGVLAQNAKMPQVPGVPFINRFVTESVTGTPLVGVTVIRNQAPT